MKKILILAAMVAGLPVMGQTPDFPNFFSLVALRSLTNQTAASSLYITNAAVDMINYEGRGSILLFIKSSTGGGADQLDTNTVYIETGTNSAAANTTWSAITNFTAYCGAANAAGSYQKIDLDIGAQKRYWRVKTKHDVVDGGTNDFNLAVYVVGAAKYK